ncbi:hypothetical protein D1872_199200 [compost metagenome]
MERGGILIYPHTQKGLYHFNTGKIPIYTIIKILSIISKYRNKLISIIFIAK